MDLQGACAPSHVVFSKDACYLLRFSCPGRASERCHRRASAARLRCTPLKHLAMNSRCVCGTCIYQHTWARSVCAAARACGRALASTRVYFERVTFLCLLVYLNVCTRGVRVCVCLCLCGSQLGARIEGPCLPSVVAHAHAGAAVLAAAGRPSGCRGGQAVPERPAAF